MCAMSVQEFRPEGSTTTEVRNAGLLAFAALVMMIFLNNRLDRVPVAAWVFFGFILLAGLSTLLSHWVDKHTVLRLDGSRVSFTNGMRDVSLAWHEIETIDVVPLKWGRSVQVMGNGTQFQFRTLAEVQYQGKIRGRLGFADGEAVLQHILEKTGLSLSKEEKGRYYYSRA